MNPQADHLSLRHPPPAGTSTNRQRPSASLRASECGREVWILVGLISELSHGRVRGLRTRRGVPCFAVPPEVERSIKLAGTSDPPVPRDKGDFELKGPFVRLLEVLRRVGDGVIDEIDVRDGLPVTVRIRERFQPERLEGGRP